MKQLKKLTFEQLEKKSGDRHVSGGLHFTDGFMVSFQNASVNQIFSYIKTSGKEFAYFVTF